MSSTEKSRLDDDDLDENDDVVVDDDDELVDDDRRDWIDDWVESCEESFLFLQPPAGPEISFRNNYKKTITSFFF